MNTEKHTDLDRDFAERFKQLEEEISHEQKEINHLESEIRHEQNEINHLQEDLNYEKDELQELREKAKEMEQEYKEHRSHHEHCHDDKFSLTFIVNGTPGKVEVSGKVILREAVEIALKETGNGGRPLDDWNVKYNGVSLDLKKTIQELHLPKCAELFLSLNAGQGGGI